jgi:hypothetical protein
MGGGGVSRPSRAWRQVAGVAYLSSHPMCWARQWHGPVARAHHAPRAEQEEEGQDFVVEVVEALVVAAAVAAAPRPCRAPHGRARGRRLQAPQGAHAAAQRAPEVAEGEDAASVLVSTSASASGWRRHCGPRPARHFSAPKDLQPHGDATRTSVRADAC